MNRFAKGVYVSKLGSIFLLESVKEYESKKFTFWLATVRTLKGKYSRTLLRSKDLKFLTRIGSL